MHSGVYERVCVCGIFGREEGRTESGGVRGFYSAFARRDESGGAGNVEDGSVADHRGRPQRVSEEVAGKCCACLDPYGFFQIKTSLWIDWRLPSLRLG